MEKILYIHGFGSDKNSSTGQFIKELLKDKYEVLVETWNLTDPITTSESINKYVVDKDISLVIASSLGAFYALSITDSIARIVINPCMDPSAELPKITQITQKIKDEFNFLKTEQADYIDWEMRAVTFGIFGNNDELFNYQERFKTLYGNMFVVKGRHKLLHKSLEEGLKEGFKYFSELQDSLKQIDSII